MKLDLKEWIAKVTRPSSATSVTIPFTPTCNGLLIGNIRANATGRTYVLFNNAKPGIIDGYTIAQGYFLGTVFVEKGKQVSYSGSANVSNTEYYFIPLVGGGTA